jgi:hypothetical protein
LGINSEKIRPSIHVYSANKASTFFQSLLDGLEEEGIPSTLQQKQENISALELGYLAAQDSNLGVGIGIDGEAIILHYVKLDKDHPLFQISQNDTANQRILGANAARLIKGIPFKQFTEEDDEHIQTDTISRDDLAYIVELIIKKLIEKGFIK